MRARQIESFVQILQILAACLIHRVFGVQRQGQVLKVEEVNSFGEVNHHQKIELCIESEVLNLDEFPNNLGEIKKGSVGERVGLVVEVHIVHPTIICRYEEIPIFKYSRI